MAIMKKSAKKYADGGPITTTKQTTKQPTKVEKKSTKVVKKPISVSKVIGDITLRDFKNAGEDAVNLATLGGYSRVKKALGGEYKFKKLGEKKYGGKISKAKMGASLKTPNNPGLKKLPTPIRNRMGFKKNGGAMMAKKGMKISKCKTGCN